MSDGDAVGEGDGDGEIRSGVSIAVAALPDADALARTIREHATACDEIVAPLEAASHIVATLAIAAAAGPVGVVVRRLDGNAVAARPDLAEVLGAPVRGVIRLDAIVRADAPEESLRAERLLTALAAIWSASGAVACDDAGAIYGPGELASLARAGRTRFESEAFVEAAADRVAVAVIDASAAADVDAGRSG
jgi:hypothetical protein